MRRVWVVVLALLVLVPIAAVGTASWFLNGDAIKTRIAEQVRRATGRELTIAGPVRLAWSFTPTISLSDVSLSNPPGFPHPQMAHIARLEAAVTIKPLLERRVQIASVTLVAPSVRLERDAAGRANWDFRPPPAPTAAPSAPSQPSPRFLLAVGAFDVTDAKIEWGAKAVTAPHLAFDPQSGYVAGSVVAAGQPFTIAGTAGPIGDAPFPLQLHATGPGVKATLAGTSAAATLTVEAADLAALSPLVGRALPPVHNVSLSAVLPEPGAFRLQAGEGSWGKLAFQRVLLTAASLSDPGTFSAAASIGQLPLSIDGHVGSIAALLRGPVPLDARIDGPGLAATASGTVGTDGQAALQIGVRSPDLGEAGAQAGYVLPSFRTLNVAAGLSIAPSQIALENLRLTSAQGDLAGNLTLTTAGRPALRGSLTSTSLDLDMLAPPPIAPTASISTPPPAAAPLATPQPARVIPNSTLPLAPLRAGDADLQLAAASLRAGGVTYKTVQAHAVLQNGTLHLEPVSAAVGSGIAHATLDVAAGATPPALHATIQAPGLPLGATSPGTLDIHADLAGSGDTVAAVASTLSGYAGVAVVDGRVPNEALERLAAGVFRTIDVPLEAGGSTTVRCAAIRADVAGGVATLTALALDTSKLALTGSGTLDLRDEAVDLHLRPQLRVGGGLSVPLRVKGTLAAPKVTLDPGAIASGRVGIVLGGGLPADTCAPALSQARGERAAPAAAPVRSVKPADLLRGLLR
ncbi:MAG: AsmA family protein [Acetobacteraceae bacterium]|nr:AsmA family protein [Acetobacteraceae bacterium]